MKKIPRIVVVSLVMLLISLLADWSWAADQMMIGDFSQGANAHGVPNGWQLKVKSGESKYSVVKTDGLSALRLQSKDSSFSIQKEVMVDLTQFPILSWQWKVVTLPTGGDFRKLKTDDQAAQMCLAFTKRKLLVYVWSSTAPLNLIGEMTAPFFMTIKAMVIRTGPAELGKWLTETRNVYEDYKKLYGDGDKKPVVAGMRIQINSQHTESSAESYFADVKFLRK